MQAEISLKHGERRGLAVAQNRAPKPAADVILRQITTEAQAIAVSMRGYKLAYIAASLNRSESYLSRIRTGKRPIPEWMVMPFCRITGTLLLMQFRQWQESLAEIRQQASESETIARLAAQLRAAA